MALKLATINSDQGLSNEQVHKIAQDSLGRLWLAHPTGISRYNGSHIKIYDSSNGLDCIGLRTLEISSSGIVWIGTDRGLEAMSEHGEKKSWKKQPVWTFGVAESVLANGTEIWVGTSFGLVQLMDDPENDELKLVSQHELGLVRSIIRGLNGELLLATVKQGLLVYKDGIISPFSNESLISEGKVLCLKYTLDGFLLAGTTDGLLVINQERQIIDRYREEDGQFTVKAISIFGDHWCLGIDHRVQIVTRKIEGIVAEDTFEMQSIVKDILVDRVDNIWVGTNNQGVKKITCLRSAIQEVWEESPKATFSIKKDALRNFLHVGGDSFFSSLEIPQKGSYSKINKSKAYATGIVWDSLVDPQDEARIWLATENGLYYRNGDASPVRFSTPDNQLMSPNRVLISRRNEIWVGTISGLYKIVDGVAEEIRSNDKQSFGYVYALSLDVEDRIWVGTLGRGVWIEVDNTFEQLLNEWLTTYANTYAIAHHQTGQTLIIQENRIVLFDAARKAKLVQTENPVGGWSAVWINDHMVAIGSNNGVVLLDVTLLEIKQRINPLLGKAAWQFTSTRALYFDGQHKLYCGINSGLYVVDLQEFEQFSSPPSLYLEGVEWENVTPIINGNHFEVSAEKWTVKVSVFADYLIDENQIGFRFKLVGFEETWSDLSSRPSVRYNSLPAGRYQLQGQVYLPLTGFGPVNTLLSIDVAVPILKGVYQFIFNGLGSLNERFITFFNRNRLLLARNVELEKQVAERKRAVEELARYRKQLEEIVTHRTEELVLQKNKAESADRMKSVFLATMSHEIRTPLNAIIGLTNVLLQGKPRSDQEENLGLVKFSGELLLSIINDILDLSKIEAGKMDLELINFNLKDLLSKVVGLMQIKANEKSIGLNFHYDPELPTYITGDPVRIGQVINNLLSNAIKFTEKGYVDFSVRVDPSSGGYCFAVKDTGIGIDPKGIESLFESFTQAHASTTRKYGGTGLGLTITKKLIHLMGADILVESKLGIGSIFSFTLQLAKGTVEHSVVQEESQIALQTSAHILIVDDNPVNQIVAGKQLKAWGVMSTFASSGEEALSLITQKTVDLILMDLRMPVMDGYETARRIRSLPDEYYQKIPIIALSASVTGKVRSKVLAAGMQDYILKPFAPETLLKTLSQFIPATQALSTELPETTVISPLKLAEFSAGDVEYKKELAILIGKNLLELRDQVIESNRTGNSELFKMVEHKLASSLMILGVDELYQIMADMKRTLAHSNTISPKTIHTFQQIISRILQELEAESK